MLVQMLNNLPTVDHFRRLALLPSRRLSTLNSQPCLNLLANEQSEEGGAK